MRYSIESRDQMYRKAYGLLSFAKNTGKNLSCKYSKKRLDCVKRSITEVAKTASKKQFKKQ